MQLEGKEGQLQRLDTGAVTYGHAANSAVTHHTLLISARIDPAGEHNWNACTLLCHDLQ